MISKADVLDSVLRECDIVLHLYEKLPDGALDHRPTPDQRSTAELLHYLAYCGLGACYAMADGNWDRYKAEHEQAEAAAAADFPAAMNGQKEKLTAFFDGLSDEQFADQDATLPTGVEMKLGRAILETAVKWLTAYRMQLFLYAKGAGNTEIGTVNCWAGRDAEPVA